MSARQCRLLTGLALAGCLAAAVQAAGAAAPGGAGGGQAPLLQTAQLDRLAAIYAGYYPVAPEAPARLLRIGLPADDVSVALWIAATAVADPYAIASARFRTKARWVELMRAYGLEPRALRVRLDRGLPASGPYARAYRILGGRTRGALTDAEVRDLVQLRLLVEHYGLPPSRVIAARGAGRSSIELILEADRRGGAKPRGG